jgi:ribA/ribD-fused uncharacterized protein
MINDFHGNYSFCSNFYPARIKYRGVEYPSSEHAYQASKTLDMIERNRIAQLSTPGKAKKAGRMVTPRSDWENVKLNIMREIVFIKFDGHLDLKELLLATGDHELIEGNKWHDTFWGVCDGIGQNYLGKILMEIRTIFKIRKDETWSANALLAQEPDRIACIS